MTEADRALLDLLRALGAANYRFVTVTPETHRRVLERDPGRSAGNLRDIFGWNLPFEESLLQAPVRDSLERSGMTVREGRLLRSRVRVASVDDRLFLHSAFPTDSSDSVFFGPDSYRYVHFLAAEIPGLSRATRLVDIGAGSGVGAVMAAAIRPELRATATDINPLALRLARINAALAGVALESIEGSGLDPVEGPIDLVIANPPFVADPAGRLYRDGGGMHGARLSLDWALAAARRIEPGGAVLLYTGSAIVEGRDALRNALAEQLPDLGCDLRYAELDPDIFGELLDQSGYEEVDRVAAVGAVIRKA
ncbi:MAG TPA: class I SAM-dependent methyltransferase [Allosphingosinicella sp.]|nr:class I SAM-dependent methyltransferase [Allosphingosinicella sp.]